MLAIVKERNKHYVTNYLAVKYNRFDSECAIFDSKNKKLKLLKIWNSINGKLSRNIFIVDTRGVIRRKNGLWVCDLLAKNDSLIQKLFKEGEVQVFEFPELEQYAKTPIIPEWFDVADETDINSLMEAALGFHDATIAEKALDGANLTIKFETGWQCFITVKFHNVKSLPYLDDVILILESKIKKCNGLFGFVLTEYVGNDGSENAIQFPTIECEKISWQIEVK